MCIRDSRSFVYLPYRTISLRARYKTSCTHRQSLPSPSRSRAAIKIPRLRQPSRPLPPRSPSRQRSRRTILERQRALHRIDAIQDPLVAYVRLGHEVNGRTYVGCVSHGVCARIVFDRVCDGVGGCSRASAACAREGGCTSARTASDVRGRRARDFDGTGEASEGERRSRTWRDWTEDGRLE